MRKRKRDSINNDDHDHDDDDDGEDGDDEHQRPLPSPALSPDQAMNRDEATSSFAIAALVAEISCVLPLGVAIDPHAAHALLLLRPHANLARLASFLPSTASSLSSSAAAPELLVVGMLTFDAASNQWLLRQHGTELVALVSLRSGLVDNAWYRERTSTPSATVISDAGSLSLAVAFEEWVFVGSHRATPAEPPARTMTLPGVFEVSALRLLSPIATATSTLSRETPMVPEGWRSLVEHIRSSAGRTGIWSVEHTREYLDDPRRQLSSSGSRAVHVIGIVAAVTPVLSQRSFLVALRQRSSNEQRHHSIPSSAVVVVAFAQRTLHWRPLLRVGMCVAICNVRVAVVQSSQRLALMACEDAPDRPGTRVYGLSFSEASKLLPPADSSHNHNQHDEPPIDKNQRVISYEGEISAVRSNGTLELDGHLTLLLNYCLFSSNASPLSLRRGACVRLANVHTLRCPESGTLTVRLRHELSLNRRRT